MIVETLPLPKKATSIGEYEAVKEKADYDRADFIKLQVELIRAYYSKPSNADTKIWIDNNAAYVRGVITARPDLCRLNDKENAEEIMSILKKIHKKATVEDSLVDEDDDVADDQTGIRQEIYAFDWMNEHKYDF